MLGYMTKTDAVKAGMTHHGSYYGIPVWVAPDHPDFLCCTKWRPLDYLLPVFHRIEGVMRSILFPDDEPMFQFKIGKKIATP